MRRLATLALGVATITGATFLAAAPAQASELNTCVVVVGFNAGPGGVSVQYVQVNSVGDCIR